MTLKQRIFTAIIVFFMHISSDSISATASKFKSVNFKFFGKVQIGFFKLHDLSLLEDERSLTPTNQPPFRWNILLVVISYALCSVRFSMSWLRKSWMISIITLHCASPHWIFHNQISNSCFKPFNNFTSLNYSFHQKIASCVWGSIFIFLFLVFNNQVGRPSFL